MNVIGVLVNKASSSFKWASALFVITMSQEVVYLCLLGQKLPSTKEPFFSSLALYEICKVLPQS